MLFNTTILEWHKVKEGNMPSDLYPRCELTGNLTTAEVLWLYDLNPNPDPQYDGPVLRYDILAGTETGSWDAKPTWTPIAWAAVTCADAREVFEHYSQEPQRSRYGNDK